MGTQQPLGAPHQRWPRRASCQGALSLTCLPTPGLCTQCPLPSIPLPASTPAQGQALSFSGELILQGMRVGTSFKVKQVTVTVLALVQCLPSWPLLSALCWAMPISLPSAGG